MRAEFTDPSFPDTHWTIIQSVGHNEESLQTWCRGCWHPVRSYIPAQGFNEQEAGDLTQRFFEKLLSKER